MKLDIQLKLDVQTYDFPSLKFFCFQFEIAIIDASRMHCVCIVVVAAENNIETIIEPI